MEKKTELSEKIRQQFDFAPYPNDSLEQSPKGLTKSLYIHNLVTSYYLRDHTVTNTKDKVILDLGCGSGFKALLLAEANPGSKVVCVDISEKSLDLARQRLEYHGFKNAEFHQISIEKIPDLNLEFDYINCDETLYLFPDPVIALQAMQAVLKPKGIIRANLHSSLQRQYIFRAQEVCQMMGLMDGNPEELEIDILKETFDALQDKVDLKAKTWKPDLVKQNDSRWFLANFLLQGDRGYTIPDLFSALKQADLELIEMVNWRKWRLIDLFKDPDNLPVFWGLSLPEMTIEQQLHLYELLNPTQRLLDFWCGHPDQGNSYISVSGWTEEDWRTGRIYLHPQLLTESFQEEVTQSISELHPLVMPSYFPSASLATVDSSVAACLFPPLLESPQTLSSLLQRWLQLHPVDPLTLEPNTPEKVIISLKESLMGLEDFGYLLMEC